MFQPFVLDAVAHLGSDLSDKETRQEILARHGIAIPVNTLHTLLGRVQKAGYLRREGGRYFRTKMPLEVTDVQSERTRVEERQRLLARRLCTTAHAEGVEVGSTDEALAMILQFLQRYHVALAFGDPDLPNGTAAEAADEQDNDEDVRAIATARFLQESATAGGEIGEIIQEMLEGFVLQNTLLLKDISTAKRRFQNLHVFMDSGLLFSAIGLRGPAAETAMRELIVLLRETGAVVDVFEATIREMRAILSLYEDRVGTSAGQRSLRPTELTRHILSNRLTPSDIRERSALIESNLRQLGVNIRELPERVPKWTSDERALSRSLMGDKGENEPRIVHDVDCVAGVLTYRRGKTTESLDNAEAIFVTDSAETLRTTRRWYAEQGMGGIAPAIHYLELSNRAWLKKPAAATKLKLHELMALCNAALRPSRAAWDRFIAYLGQLEASGELSSDEVIALIASELTDRVLIDEHIGEDSDASSLSEVVERVKASYKEAADRAVTRAKEDAERAASELKGTRQNVRARVATVATVVSWAVVTVPAMAFIIGAVSSVILAIGDETPSVAVVALALAPLALGGLLGVLFGFHLRAWRRWVADRLARGIEKWLVG